MVAQGGVLCLLQQYNFLYNQKSRDFRRDFIKKWDVREILDFISVRGLFKKGGADTKVIVVVTDATSPPADRKILHATFRRNGRADAEQGFDIDYYDLHWISRELALSNDGIWRADLLGGGRVLGLMDRLGKFRTLGQYAEKQGWDFGEGFIEGQRNVALPADHIVGKPLLPSEALTLDGIEVKAIGAPNKPIEGPRSKKRFSPPILLVREQMDIPHAIWSKNYLTTRPNCRICGYKKTSQSPMGSGSMANNSSLSPACFCSRRERQAFYTKSHNAFRRRHSCASISREWHTGY